MSSLSPLKKWAQQRPSCLALKSLEKNYTWVELADDVDCMAAGLSSQGIKAGEVLACVGQNSVDNVLAYLACMELGAICALIMPQTQVDLEAKLATLYPEKAQANIGCIQLNWPLSLYANIDLDLRTDQGFTAAYHQDKPASIIFTSGSTGRPKAVVHTSRQHLASASGLLETLPFTQRDTWLLSLPIYHVSGLAIIYRWLLTGAALKLANGDWQDDLIGVTHASFVATQLQRVLDSTVLQDLSHVLLGGSHIPLSLSQQASKRGIETWVGYGMTEAASTVTAKKVDGSEGVGQVLAKRNLMLKDKRIHISGETLALGYYEQGQIVPLKQHSWFDTKDLGRWKNGELHIIGRVDNLFISGGENIHCEEIEAVLHQVPNIIQAIVVPVEDKEFGHRPVAVIKSGFSLDIEEIEKSLSGELVKFKWPIAYYEMPEHLSRQEIKVSRSAVNHWVRQHRSSAAPL